MAGGGKAKKKMSTQPPPSKGIMIKSATQLNREAGGKTKDEKVKDEFSNLLGDVIKKLSNKEAWTSLHYMDATNLYGWAMQQNLPTKLLEPRSDVR